MLYRIARNDTQWFGRDENFGAVQWRHFPKIIGSAQLLLGTLTFTCSLLFIGFRIFFPRDQTFYVVIS